jgi:competence protein ComFB
MEIHNTIEDTVIGSVEIIFDSIKQNGNPEGFCFCGQCQTDTICYVLNRCQPHYINSHRGVARLEQKGIERQQLEADIASLIHDGLKRVKHNQRLATLHKSPTDEEDVPRPVYNIPIIVGRIYDGTTFAPLAGIKVELRWKGELVNMLNHNWQHPYILVANTAGTFTFWPTTVNAEISEDHKIFEYSISINASEYEPLTHYFKIPVVSKFQAHVPFSIDRSFKLPDLYLFPPGEAEQNG